MKLKEYDLRELLLRCFIVILVILSIAALISPILKFGSEFIYYAKTYAYTRVDKQFLKYKNNIVYTTDGCKYEDKNKKFEELVLNVPENSVEEGSLVEV